MVLVAVFAFNTGATAASICSGKSSSSCSSNSSCIWVSGYKKKDGSKVKSYCRAVGKSGSKADKKSKSKSKDKKSKDKKSKDKKSKDKKSKDKKSKDKKSKDKKSKK